MSRKNKKSTEWNRPADQDPDQDPAQDPALANENITEPAAAPQEAPASNPDDAARVDSSNTAQDAPDVPSADDLLEDVRRALIEDEAQESQKNSKWWKRIGLGGRKQEPPTDEPKVVEEIDLPITPELSSDATVDDLKEELESEEHLEQIDELIDLLDEDTVSHKAPVQKVEEPPAELEKPVDFEQLKKQAFQPRPDAAGTETLSEVRSLTLEGGEQVFVEVESKPQDPFNERVKSVENALKPFRRYILIAIAILGVGIAGIALAITISAVQRMRPQPTPAAVPDMPYPTLVSLPGGWSFNLGRGSLSDGRWYPKGAEWLEGTEVCRWVSLPWSRQLEAVLRTLNTDDPIELQMSNSDRLVYEVYSIRQMSPDEMQELDTNTPCLLIMLTEDDAEKRWVLTARP